MCLACRENSGIPRQIDVHSDLPEITIYQSKVAQLHIGVMLHALRRIWVAQIYVENLADLKARGEIEEMEAYVQDTVTYCIHI